MRFVSIFFLILSSSFLAQAEVPNMTAAVPASTGGAGRGAVDPYGIVYLNPAGIARLRDRVISTSISENYFAASLIDAGDGTLVNAGLSYRQQNKVSGDASLRQFTLTVADKTFDYFTFGFNINYFDFRHFSEGASKKLQSDLGLTWVPNERWIFGITGQGYAIQDQGDEVGTMESLEPLAVKSAVGFSYIYANFVRFRFDLESENNHRWGRPAALMGLESYLNDWILWRLGYQNRSESGAQYVSTGLGFQGPKFGLHYAFIQETRGDKESRHSVDLGLPF